MSPRFFEGSYIKLFLAGATIGAVVFGVPVFSFAAYNDVTLATTNAEIYVGGITLVVASSNAVVESITVDTNDFTVTMQSGSSLIVTSADRRTITATGGSYDFDCGSSVSTLTINNITSSKTYTVTPSASTCSTTSSSSSGGGGGGGIVGSGPLAPSPVGVSTRPVGTTTTDVAIPVQTIESCVFPEVVRGDLSTSLPTIFNQTLSLGMVHSDIKRLQELLNSDLDTRVAESGLGSPGNESTYFGNLTKQAVQKFQTKHGIASLSTPGFGMVGPRTRAKLQEVFQGVSVSTPSVSVPDATIPTTVSGTSAVFTRLLYGGVTHPEVKRLQILLNSDPDTRIAESGVGSPGQETEHFGILTERAVQKFQAKHGVISSGTPGTTGYGWVGPKTRLKLQEIFGSQ